MPFITLSGSKAFRAILLDRKLLVEVIQVLNINFLIKFIYLRTFLVRLFAVTKTINRAATNGRSSPD